MIFLRSLAYHVTFVAWTLGLGILYLPLLLAPRHVMQRAAAFWLAGALALQRRLLGLDFEIRGRQHLPAGALVIAAKHQSAWDTLVFHHLVGDPAFILKKELLSLPFIGWYLRKTGQIAIDRKGGARALRLMAEASRAALAQGRQIVIFPEGHRQEPGTTGRYQSGVALLQGMGAPVIGIAVNSGLFWGRNAFLRRPGVITLEILPPFPEAADRASFMASLQEAIESATRRLEAEAIERFPHLAHQMKGCG